jgi:hypothetical protein
MKNKKMGLGISKNQKIKKIRNRRLFFSRSARVARIVSRAEVRANQTRHATSLPRARSHL